MRFKCSSPQSLPQDTGQRSDHPGPWSTDPHNTSGTGGSDSKEEAHDVMTPSSFTNNHCPGKSQELRDYVSLVFMSQRPRRQALDRNSEKWQFPCLLLCGLALRKTPLLGDDELTLDSRTNVWVGWEGTGKETKKQGNTSSFRWTGCLMRSA